MCIATRCSTAVSVLLVVCSSLLWAQRPQTRQGFWIGFGFGYGTLGVSCDGCPDIDREGGLSGYLKMGGTLSPKVLLGGESNGWSKEVNGSTVTAGNLSFAAYFYPQPTSGLFVTGGLGLSSYQEEGFDMATGFGFSAGLGYDIRVGDNVSLAPVANFFFGSVGDLEEETGFFVVPGVKQNVFQVALGVTFH